MSFFPPQAWRQDASSRWGARLSPPNPPSALSLAVGLFRSWRGCHANSRAGKGDCVERNHRRIAKNGGTMLVFRRKRASSPKSMSFKMVPSFEKPIISFHFPFPCQERQCHTWTPNFIAPPPVQYLEVPQSLFWFIHHFTIHSFTEYPSCLADSCRKCSPDSSVNPHRTHHFIPPPPLVIAFPSNSYSTWSSAPSSRPFTAIGLDVSAISRHSRATRDACCLVLAGQPAAAPQKRKVTPGAPSPRSSQRSLTPGKVSPHVRRRHVEKRGAVLFTLPNREFSDQNSGVHRLGVAILNARSYSSRSRSEGAGSFGSHDGAQPFVVGWGAGWRSPGRALAY